MNTGPIIAIVFILLVFALSALRTGLGYLSVRRDAREEWPGFRQTRPRDVKGLDASQFQRAYVRTHAPRGALFGMVALFAAAVLTPVIMLALTNLYGVLFVTPTDGGMANESLVNEVRRQLRREGPLVYAFFMFFGLIASWGLIAFVVAHFFHKGRPGDLEDELHRARGEADFPDAQPARQRPKWSPLVQTKNGLRLPENVKED